MPGACETIVDIQEVGYVYYNGVEYQVKTAFGIALASGNTQLVAAVAGKSIVLINYMINNPTGNSTFKFTSYDGVSVHTDITLTFDTTSNVIHRGPINRIQATGISGEAIYVHAGANNISAQVWYIEV